MSTRLQIMDTVPSAVRDFLNYMSAIKGRSKNTIVSYGLDLRQFLAFLRQRENAKLSDTPLTDITVSDFSDDEIKNLTLMDIMEYLTYSGTELENNAKSRMRKSVALRQFFKYLTNNKQWFVVSPAQNLELPKAKKALPKHLSIEQAHEVIDTASEIRCWSDARDYCILIFFLNCGMRLSELVGIDVNDITGTKNYETGEKITVLKVLGKGNKERIIYLNNACVQAFDSYIAYRAEAFPNEKALFVSSRGGRISNRRVQQIIDNLLEKSGLSGMGFSVHKLRHTAATLMYQNGVDVRVLKEVLGHENLDTTQIYTHVSNVQMKQAMDKNPLAGTVAPKKTKDDVDGQGKK